MFALLEWSPVGLLLKKQGHLLFFPLLEVVGVGWISATPGDREVALLHASCVLSAGRLSATSWELAFPPISDPTQIDLQK